MKGSEKQIAWAESIKADFRKYLSKCYCDDVEADEALNMSIWIDLFCENHDDASWWIENRSHTWEWPQLLCDWIDGNADEYLEEYTARGGTLFDD